MTQRSKQILLLCDPRGWFWKKYNEQNQTESLDVDLLRSTLISAGFAVAVANIAQLDFDKNYRGIYVLYTSSEDFNGGTKSFIEDILVWLEIQGAILIPAYPYLRAHHNKVMMELLRQSFPDSDLKTIHSQVYPSRQVALRQTHPWPAIVKSASGAGSQGVSMAASNRQFSRITRSLARMTGWEMGALFAIRNFIRKIKRQGPINYHNSKFVVQNFIPNLDGDYKVLAFDCHYFVLHRQNRPHDFRASGSGQFIAVNPAEIEGLLDFARQCKQSIDSPFISMDLAFDGKSHHLIEFQCVSFGLKALTLSNGYYKCDEAGKWQYVETKSSPELEFAAAIQNYLRQKSDFKLG